jgi:circadian clock protein KaiC
MATVPTPSSLPELARLPTLLPGLDAVLGGGLLAGDTYVIAGELGTGKTTLGNHLAFAHAAAGGTAIIATFLTETHDQMLAHLQGLAFADPALVAHQVHYMNLGASLEAGGVDGVLATLGQTVHAYGATLLVIDSVGEATPAHSAFATGEFLHRLQVRLSMLGCTTVVLAAGRDGASGHADGVIELTHETAAGRDVRWLRVAKLRGSRSLNGRHRFVIGEEGVVVYPRLEAALSEVEPAALTSNERLAFGVPGLDAMLSGGVLEGSSTLLLGTPGAGKTLLGLHFLAEGARRGEPGLIASFLETAADLAKIADRVGMRIGQHMTSGLVQVLWRPPLELGPDAWAWDLLAAVEEHRPKRLLIDAFTDLLSLFADPERQYRFVNALTNALRRQGVTMIVNFEIDSYVSQELAAAVPNISAVMGNGILLRSLELESRFRRIVSILKLREGAFDPTIREFVIGDEGIVVGEPLAATGLLTGAAIPEADIR